VRHLLLFCSLYFNWKFETLFFCWGWIVLNLFLTFEQKWASCSYKIVLIKNKRSAIFRYFFANFRYFFFRYPPPFPGKLSFFKKYFFLLDTFFKKYRVPVLIRYSVQYFAKYIVIAIGVARNFDGRGNVKKILWHYFGGIFRWRNGNDITEMTS